MLNKIGFGNQCLLALFLGIGFGLIVPLSWAEEIAPVGLAYLQLLKMIIIPISFVLIVTSFTRLGNISKIRQLGGRTLFWFLTTAVIAASIGLGTALWLNPGAGFYHTMSLPPLAQTPQISQILLDMVPGNLFDQMARGKVIPVIIFAVLFAIAVTSCGEEAKNVKLFFDGLSNVIYKITRWVIRLTPIGIFVFVAQVSAHYGVASLLPFAKFIVTVYVACFFQMIAYSLLLLTICKINPLKFFAKAWPMLLTAFTTSSSLATLPMTLDTLVKRLGVSESVASFVAPLGANAKMDGCGAIYPAILCVFTASLFGLTLDMHQYILIIITAALATIGTAGVPGAAVVMTMVVLSSLGFPFAGLAMVIGIDKMVDMIRTTINVAGTAVCATLVEHTTEESVSYVTP